MTDKIRAMFEQGSNSEPKQMARSYFSAEISKLAVECDEVMEDGRYAAIMLTKFEELAMWMNKGISHGGVKKGFTFNG